MRQSFDWLLCFVFSSFFLFISCGSLEESVKKQEVKEPQFLWKLQSQAPAQNPDFVSLKLFAEKVKNMSDNKFIISVYPAGAITKGSEMFDGVKERKTEMAQGWPNWWLSKDPAWNMIQSGPFEFMTIESSMIYFYEDEGMTLANELSNPHGILWRPAWWSGMEFGILTRFPAKGLDDLKGKKIRMGPGLPQEVLTEAAGSFAIPTVPEEIYNALKTEVIDGVEWTVPSATWPMKFHEVCSYVLVPAVWQPAVLGDFLINEKAYNELPLKFRAILESAMKEFALEATIRGKELDMEALKKYREAGITLVKWSDSDILRWKKAAEKIYKKHIDASSSFKKVYDSKMHFKEKYQKYMKTHGPYEKEIN